MSEEGETTNTEEALELIDAILYGDAFDCAVTLDEIWRYSRVRITREQLHERLRGLILKKLLEERDAFYFLPGRERLAELRKERRQRAMHLKRRARRVARFLQYAPFVRGIVLTGSVAVEDAQKGADVDILVIVAERRIALAFVLLGTLSRFVSRQIFCPNYYVSGSHLGIPRHDRYVARELLQAEPLTSQATALIDANRWAQEQLPNARPTTPSVRALAGGAFLQRIAELPFAGSLGEFCEGKARNIAMKRLRAHYGTFLLPVPDDIKKRFELGIELRFHGDARVDDCLERYQRSRMEFARRLQEDSPATSA